MAGSTYASFFDRAYVNDRLLAEFWYADEDADGYGDPESGAEYCSAPLGFVQNESDCNDTEPTVFPGAFDVCFDALDNDCDGEQTPCPQLSAGWYRNCFLDDDGVLDCQGFWTEEAPSGSFDFFATGAVHGCAIQEGETICWGHKGQGKAHRPMRSL